MENGNCVKGIERQDLEFTQEIAAMAVHSKILLKGMLIGLTIAEQKTEKEFNGTEHCC